MSSKLFGTDGVRGEANAGVMTVETAVLIGQAIGVLCRGRNQRSPAVLV